MIFALLAGPGVSAAGERPPAIKRSFLNPPPDNPSPALQQRGHSYRQGLQGQTRRFEFQLIQRSTVSPSQRTQGVKPQSLQRLPQVLRETRRERDRVNRALNARPALAPAVGPLSPSGRPPLRR